MVAVLEENLVVKEKMMEWQRKIEELKAQLDKFMKQQEEMEPL